MKPWLQCAAVLLLCACTSIGEIAPTLQSDITEPTECYEATEGRAAALEGKIIYVDAGHGIAAKNKKERISPNSEETKTAFLGGTSGAIYSEEELNLIVAKKMEKKLSELGAVVYMAREEHTTDKGNIDRAEEAGAVNADLWIRIHADGSDNKNARGISVLVPSNSCVNASVRAKSAVIAKEVSDALCGITDAENRGISRRDDLVGFNWTTVPVILVEMGFMSNKEEDALLSTDAYQEKIAQGVCNALYKYWQQEDENHV